MLRREYPPLLYGRAEDQIAQLRAYLVRLIEYLDEAVSVSTVEGFSQVERAALGEWQKSVDNAIGALRSAAGAVPLIQHGSADATESVQFARAYADTPAVFVTAGTVSDADASGFTLTTNETAQWIAVGDAARR